MSNLIFVSRNGVDRIDSRLVAKEMGVKNHKQWLFENVVKKQALIEEKTGQTVEFDKIPNKKARPTKIALLTEKQFYFLIAMFEGKTEQAIDAKAIIGNAFAENRDKKKPVKANPNNWTRMKNNIIIEPSFDEDIPVNPLRSFTHSELQPFFSPDTKFAAFLESLEEETGYSLKWNVENIDPFAETDESTAPSYTCSPAQAKYLKQYEALTYNSDSEDGYYCPAFDKDLLPFLPQWCIRGQEPPIGVVRVNKSSVEDRVWYRLVALVVKCVKIYNSEKIKVEQEEDVDLSEECWDATENDSPILKELLKAEERLKAISSNSIDLYGFQAHKDWLDWLGSDDERAKAARLCHFGSDKPIHFKTQEWLHPSERWGADSAFRLAIDPRTKVIQYEYWEAYEEGYQYELDSNKFSDDYHYKPTPKKDHPLFDAIRLYNRDFEPIFDWYLENIWLPQHSLRFFKVCDPDGYPQLLRVLEDLPANVNLPRQFTRAVQKQLARPSI